MPTKTSLFIFNFDPIRRAAQLPKREFAWLLSIAAALTITFKLCTAILPDPHHENHMTLAADALRAHGPDIQVIAIGPSHVFCGLNPKEFSNPEMNLSASAMDYTCLEALLDTWLDHLPNLRLAMIESDPIIYHLNTIESYDGDYHRLFDLRVDIGKLQIPLTQSLDLRYNQFMYRYAARFLAKRKLAPIDLFNPEPPPPLADQPGFQPHDRMIDTATDAEKALTRHRNKIKQYPKTPDTTRNHLALTRMIDKLAARNVRVVLIRMPKHETYRRNRPPWWDQQYQTRVDALLHTYADQRLELWNMDELTELQDHHFRDANHLNSTGASALTQAVNSRVIEILDPTLATHPGK